MSFVFKKTTLVGHDDKFCRVYFTECDFIIAARYYNQKEHIPNEMLKFNVDYTDQFVIVSCMWDEELVSRYRFYVCSSGVFVSKNDDVDLVELVPEGVINMPYNF